VALLIKRKQLKMEWREDPFRPKICRLPGAVRGGCGRVSAEQLGAAQPRAVPGLPACAPLGAAEDATNSYRIPKVRTDSFKRSQWDNSDWGRAELINLKARGSERLRAVGSDSAGWLRLTQFVSGFYTSLSISLPGDAKPSQSVLNIKNMTREALRNPGKRALPLSLPSLAACVLLWPRERGWVVRVGSPAGRGSVPQPGSAGPCGEGCGCPRRVTSGGRAQHLPSRHLLSAPQVPLQQLPNVTSDTGSRGYLGQRRERGVERQHLQIQSLATKDKKFIQEKSYSWRERLKKCLGIEI